MKKLDLNSTMHIVADSIVQLKLHNDHSELIETICTEDQLDPIYRLAALKDEERRDFLASRQNGEQTRDALESSGILVPREDDASSDRAPGQSAFFISSFKYMRDTINQAPRHKRDGLDVFDGIFPDEVRLSIDIWVRALPYRKIDLDRTDVRDLHWIYTMKPPLVFVRSLPFLRALDDFIRKTFLDRSQTVLRAHIYSGSSEDIFHAHSDSEDMQDVTAIYYPCRWLEEWGGELLFYDRGEPRWAVQPHSGRLIVFHGSREHRVGAISSCAEGSRHSIVLRYGSRGIPKNIL
jgi:hypothetical protein